MEWGGSWSGFQDTPHFQYTSGLSIQDLKNGKKLPENMSSNKTINTAKPTESETAFQKSYEEAIEALVKVGIIQSKDIWVPHPSIKYTKTLIIKLGKHILGVDDYEEIIELFAKNSAISQVDLWRKGEYNQNHVKWLIEKIVKYL